MNSQGKTIQIYCPAGEPRGLRIAEITTRIIQAVVAPRAKLDEALQRPEINGVGLYFLFGESESGGRPVVYIGEADECTSRLREHHAKKEFWSTAVCIVSRTGSLTKAHGRMLEWLAIGKARAAGRFKLENGNSGGECNVPEWMRSDIAEIFETAEILLAAVGFPVFDPAAGVRPAEERNVFFCRRGSSEARGVYNEEGFVVLAGSIARAGLTSSAHEWVKIRRDELIRDGTLRVVPEGLRFERDVPFPSPSAAAAMVTGASANGWVEWKNSAGRTLDEMHRQDSTA